MLRASQEKQAAISTTLGRSWFDLPVLRRATEAVSVEVVLIRGRYLEHAGAADGRRLRPEVSERHPESHPTLFRPIRTSWPGIARFISNTYCSLNLRIEVCPVSHRFLFFVFARGEKAWQEYEAQRRGSGRKDGAAKGASIRKTGS
jgi:hypothetical protein